MLIFRFEMMLSKSCATFLWLYNDIDVYVRKITCLDLDLGTQTRFVFNVLNIDSRKLVFLIVGWHSAGELALEQFLLINNMNLTYVAKMSVLLTLIKTKCKARCELHLLYLYWRHQKMLQDTARCCKMLQDAARYEV